MKPSTSASSSTAQHQFLVCRGNYSNVVRRALHRRPWWRDMVAEDCKSYPKPHQKLNASQQKLSHERQDFYCNDQLGVQEFDLLWKPTSKVRLQSAKKGADLEQLGTVHTIPLPTNRSSSNVQLVNHLSNHECMTTKTGLCRSLREYYTNTGLNLFHVVPETFLVASTFSDDVGWSNFYQRFKQLAKANYNDLNMPIKQCTQNMWIVKPPNSNQGQGIRVFSSLSKIKKFVGVHKGQHSKVKGDEWVVQKYLERPLLLWGRKFDIRIWVLVTPSFDILVYRQGYLRTSSSTFSTEKNCESSSFVHLTNYCMQKNSSSVGKYEDGNTLSYADLQRYIDEHFIELGLEASFDVNVQIMSKIKTMIVDAVLAARAQGMGDNATSSSDQSGQRKSFELFGYDFMVDEDFRPWLIEVNTNPYLGGQNEWHGELVEVMIEDMVRTVIDPLFPEGSGPPSSSSSSSSINIDSSLEQSKWRQGFEMLWSEKRGYVHQNGPDSIASRAAMTGTTGNGLAWYYAPMAVPLNNDVQERRKHLSSRDRNVIKAKKRIEQKRKQIAKNFKDTREKKKTFKNIYKNNLEKHQLRCEVEHKGQKTKKDQRGRYERDATTPKQGRHTNSSSSASASTVNSPARDTIPLSPVKKSNASHKYKYTTTATTTTLATPNLSPSKSSPPTSPILRARSKPNTLAESNKRKQEKREQFRQLKKEFSRHVRQSNASPSSSSSSSSVSTSSSTAASAIKKRMAKETYDTRRKTYTAPLRRDRKSTSSSSLSHRSRTVGGRFLPTIDTAHPSSSLKTNNDTIDLTSPEAMHATYHKSVSSPPRRLPNKILEQRRFEALARARFECGKQKQEYELKRETKLILRQKQQAWVEENLKHKIYKRSLQPQRNEKLQVKLDHEEKERLAMIAKENQLINNRRIEMKRKWMKRQKLKKTIELKRKEQLLNDQRMLDILSQQRQCDNQIKYNLWKQSKRDAIRRQKLEEDNMYNEGEIMLEQIKKLSVNYNGGGGSSSKHDEEKNDNEGARRSGKSKRNGGGHGLHGLFHNNDGDQHLSLKEMEQRHKRMQRQKIKKNNKELKRRLKSIHRKNLSNENKAYQEMILDSKKESSSIY